MRSELRGIKEIYNASRLLSSRLEFNFFETLFDKFYAKKKPLGKGSALSLMKYLVTHNTYFFYYGKI